MHPLTKILYGSYMGSPVGEDDKIQSWAKERSEWLKAQAYEGVITPKMVDEAFQIEPETLEKKIDEIIEAAKYAKVLENEHTKKSCIDKIISTVREYDSKK